MAQIRVTGGENPKDEHDCDRIQIDSYLLEEVLLPLGAPPRTVNAIRVRVFGRNLKAVATPLELSVGGEMLRFIRIAPDEASAEGILLHEPKAGAFVEVRLGPDAARAFQPVDPAAIRRLR